ncbi:MAG: organic solvent transporter substrate-binding protein [Frankiales bacterium]|jgi:phospholipid/cholesterol/gamma-HCH transport system substrate-binding protein|nr:organic solvent transporter substrate-binding protein [Frankiales bacterium]
MSLNKATVTGGAVLVAFTLSLGIAFTSQRGLVGRDYTLVDVAFEDIGPALRVGNDVRSNGVRVGQVRDIAGKAGKARLVLQLDGERPVYRDAKAFVDARSALGQKLVQFDPGTPAAGRLPDGAVLEPGPAGNATDLDALLAVLDEPTRTALAATVRTAGRGAARHAEDLNDLLGASPDLLEDSARVSRALSAPEADLDTLLTTARTLSQRLKGREQELGDLVREMDVNLGDLAVDDGAPLDSTLERLPTTLGETRKALVDLGRPLDDLRVTAGGLRDGGAALGDSTADIRATLRDVVEPLQDVPGVAQQALPAVDGLTGLVTDARPLAPKVRRAVTLAATPLDVLAPYSPEVSLWFAYASDALSEGDKNGHWLRLNTLANSESFSGAGPLGTTLPDPITSRNAYPAPGEAQKQTTSGQPR